jgi:hypothetical protein
MSATPIFDRLVEEMGHPLLRNSIEKAAETNKAALDQLTQGRADVRTQIHGDVEMSAKPKPPPGRKGVKRQSA